MDSASAAAAGVEAILVASAMRPAFDDGGGIGEYAIDTFARQLALQLERPR